MNALVIVVLLLSFSWGVVNTCWVEVSEQLSSEEPSDPVSEEDANGVPPVHCIAVDIWSKDQAPDKQGKKDSGVQVRVSERGVDAHQEVESRGHSHASEEKISVSSGKDVQVNLVASYKHINLCGQHVRQKNLRIGVEGSFLGVLNDGQIWHPVPGPDRITIRININCV